MPIINKHQEEKRLKYIAEICNNIICKEKKLNLIDIGYAGNPNKYLNTKTINITGVDIQSNQKKIKYPKEIILDATDNLEELGIFDIVIAAEFIEHIEDPYSFLRNLHKITNPKSKVILSTPNPLGFPILLFELINSKKYFYNNTHKYYFLPRWMEKMICDTGWKLEKKIGIPISYLPQFCITCNQIIYVISDNEK